MPYISRERALCIYYQLKYSETNISIAEERFKRVENEHEICYIDDPTTPVLALKERVYGAPFIFKEYLSEKEPRSRETSVGEEPQLETKMQVLKFLDEAYLPENYLPVGRADGIYVRKLLTLADVFANLNLRTSYITSMSQNGFSSFCGKNKVAFVKQKESQKRKRENDGPNVRKWIVHEMKSKHQDDLVKDIISYPQRYRELISTYKENGTIIVGYARKSPGTEEDDVRSTLLSDMMTLLRSRSMVDKVFISPFSRASQAIADRDEPNTLAAPQATANIDESNILALKDADGTTQDMIHFLNNTPQQVILVTIDYAGLTTDPDDLSLFVRNHKKIDHIYVDRLPTAYKVERYTRHQLLNDENCRKKFDCRFKPVQRSLT